jgi:hypothetical protein
VEAFDPTYWIPSARHTKVEGLTETKSSLVDSWTVQVPIAEGSPNTTEIRIRMFLLPVHAWTSLLRVTLKNSLHVFDDHMVSYLRNEREVEIGSEPRLKLKKHQMNAWLRVEIEFIAEADEAFGVAATKQGVRLQQYAADLILEHDNARFERTITDMRKTIRDGRVLTRKSCGWRSSTLPCMRIRACRALPTSDSPLRSSSPSVRRIHVSDPFSSAFYLGGRSICLPGIWSKTMSSFAKRSGMSGSASP